LDTAFKRFFKGIAHRPRFKKRDRSRDSFYVGGDQVKIKGKKIWVPNLGLVRLKESLRFTGKINSATFSRTANRWFVSIQVELIEESDKCQSKETIGVDLGINKMAVLSDSSYVESPKPLKKNLRRLARYQRKLKKKEFKSKNYFKQKTKVAKTHMRISNIRKDVLHKTTTYITKSFQKISIEDLHIKGMLKNHKLARAISDIGFGEFRRQLEYKSEMRGNVLFVADRFFPSSKKCSSCGDINRDLTLKDRTYACPCGLSIDRDLNAALNLEKLINKNVRQALSELTPVEITEIFGFNKTQKTRIVEPGIKQQIYLDRFA
jgi:putative transposase